MNSTAQGLGENGACLDEVRRALEPEPSLLERVTGDEQVWQGKIFSVDHLEVELADGSHAWREVVHHHGGAGVVAIQGVPGASVPGGPRPRDARDSGGKA